MRKRGYLLAFICALVSVMMLPSVARAENLVPWNYYAETNTLVINGSDPSYGSSTASGNVDLSKNYSISVSERAPWQEYNKYDWLANVTKVDIKGTIAPKSMGYWFWNFDALNDINLEAIDASNLTSVASMFANCKSLQDISGLTNWQTNDLKDATGIFSGCKSLNDISPLSVWNTANLTTTRTMFLDCAAIDNVDALSEWNVSGVTDTSGMFKGCTALTDINALASWRPSALKDASSMFSSTGITNIDALLNWQPSSLQNASSMFSSTGIANLNALQNWSTPVLNNMGGMFANCKSLQDISGISNWDVSKVETMSSLLSGCEAITSVSALAGWQTSSLTNLSGAFSNCSALENLDGLGSWNVTGVTTLASTFSGCTSLNDVSALEDWDTSSVKTLKQTFEDDEAISDIGPIGGWNVNAVENMDNTFNDCKSIQSFENLTWKTSNLNSMAQTFYQCESVNNIDGLNTWDVSKVTNMDKAFAYCESIENVDSLITWKTDSLTDMYSLFSGCSSLSDISGIANFNTSKVANFGLLFFGCRALKDVNALSEWDTSNVKSMYSLFTYTSVGDARKLAKWDFSNVTNMQSIFYGISSRILRIDDWNIQNPECSTDLAFNSYTNGYPDPVELIICKNSWTTKENKESIFDPPTHSLSSGESCDTIDTSKREYVYQNPVTGLFTWPIPYPIDVNVVVEDAHGELVADWNYTQTPFTVEVTPVAGAPKPTETTGVTDETGAIPTAYPLLEPDGTYSYTVKQIKGDAENLTYETSEHTYTIKVDADGNETVSWDSTPIATGEKPTIVNTLAEAVQEPEEMPAPRKDEVTPGNGVGVKVGEEIVYRITYTNASKTPQDVTIVDPIDVGLEVVGTEPTATYNPSGTLPPDCSVNYKWQGTVTWVIPSVPAGETGSVTLTTRVNENARQANTVKDQAFVQVGDSVQQLPTDEPENPIDEPKTVSYTPTVTKRVLDKNRVPLSWDWQTRPFTFTLTSDNAPMPTSATAITNEHGVATWSPVTLECGKTYAYTLSEVEGSIEGMTYDATPHALTVSVDENGHITAYVMENGERQLPRIVNTYEEPAKEPEDLGNVSFPLTMEKALQDKDGNKVSGWDFAANPFTFKILAIEGTVDGAVGEMHTVTPSKTEATTNAHGVVTWDGVELPVLSKGGYTYTVTIQEKAGNTDGMTYDSATHTANLRYEGQELRSITYDGKLVRGYDEHGMPVADVPAITNTYELPKQDEPQEPDTPDTPTVIPVTYDFEVKKMVKDGSSGLEIADWDFDAHPFSFILSAPHSAPLPNNLRAVTDATGTLKWDSVTLTSLSNAPRTFNYTLYEEEPQMGGIFLYREEQKLDVTVENGKVVAVTLNGAPVTGTPTVVNTYSAVAEPDQTPDLSAVIYTPEISKVVTGEDGKAISNWDFDAKPIVFEIASDDAPLPAFTRAATTQGGAVRWASVSLERGKTYTYTVSEVEGDIKGMDYETEPHTLIVSVADDGTVTETFDGTPIYDEAWATVTNAYVAPAEPEPDTDDGDDNGVADDGNRDSGNTDTGAGNQQKVAAQTPAQTQTDTADSTVAPKMADTGVPGAGPLVGLSATCLIALGVRLFGRRGRE